MKLDNSSKTASLEDMTEVLSNMRTLLIDVMLEKSLSDASRIKLKECISMMETFSNVLNYKFTEEEKKSTNTLTVLHSGLSKSSECLNVKSGQMTKSRSTSDLARFDVYENYEDDEIDLDNLKETYLQAVNEFNTNSEINGASKVNKTKPEVNSDKPEIHQSRPDVNATKTDAINLSKTENDGNVGKTNDKQNANVRIESKVISEQEIVQSNPEVVKREGKGSKPRRKRDSSTLFDISLDDLTEPDHSGFLAEKHSGKEWWCVLQDQHLCMFPSQNPQELAYDVLLVPCCEISLDDVYNESPVFRLTQVGSTPWVFSAGIERNLRAWIRALYRACGRDDANWSMRSSKKGRGRKDKKQKRNMKVLTSTIDESEEVEETLEEVEEKKVVKVEEKKILENGIKQKEIEDRKDENGVEENGKDVLQTCEIVEAADCGNELNVDEERDTKGEIKREKMRIERENTMTTEECKRGEDEINKNENKENNAHENDPHMEEKCLTGRKEHQESINREDQPTTPNDSEVKQQTDDTRSEAKGDGSEEKFEIKTQEHKGDNIDNSENRNDIGLPQFGIDDDHSDYVISPQSVGQKKSESQEETYKKLKSMERKATKKRIKMLRWLKKAIVDIGEDDVMVIGDIYKIVGPGDHMKLWCTIAARQLYCYLRVTDAKPESVIPLDNCSAVPSSVNVGKKFAFDIEKDGVKLVTFAVKSLKERARWMEIIKTKRGMIPLAEVADESGEEATGSGTSEEDNGDDDYEYVKVENPPKERDYAVPMSEDDLDDAGYISVLAIECEVARRKTTKKNRKYNPNITSKSGIEFLTERDVPSMISTLPRDKNGMSKQRSPAPLPRVIFPLSGKNTVEFQKPAPAIHLESSEKAESENGSDYKAVDSQIDLNNNSGVDSVVKVVCPEELTNDELLSSSEQGILRCQLTASSWLPDSPPCQARLFPQLNRRNNMIGAWRPEKNEKTQFLEIDLGDLMTVGAIAIKGRPDFDEKGGEFVKSFTIHYSIDKETWIPYKSHGKIKVFQGISNANQEQKKYFKNKTVAQYFRIYPQSWQNHIALRVSLLSDDVRSKKKGDKSSSTSPTLNRPVSPAKKVQLKKEDISVPMDPSSDCLLTVLADPAEIRENSNRHSNAFESSADCSDNPTSMESRKQLREKLLSKEKREQITKLEVLTKHVELAKNRMIVVNTSGPIKREAIELEHDYLVANLELVKAKKRLIDIETEMRELRLFGEMYTGRQDVPEEGKPVDVANPKEIAKSDEVTKSEMEEANSCAEKAKPTEVPRPTAITKPPKPLKRRSSKEDIVCSDAVSYAVDRDGFNSPGDPPPARKVMDNVKVKSEMEEENSCAEKAKPTEVPRPTAITKPPKPLKRRPSKEVMVCSDAVSPAVDRDGFNSPGDPPPARKVMDNVKLFEKLQQ